MASGKVEGNKTSAVAEKLKLLLKYHALQRVQLELTLETTPRDSRYSTSLMDLMKKEELTIREGGSQSTINELIKAVDKALIDETSRYFRKVTAQNVRKWAALSVKLQRDREAFKTEFGLVAVHSEGAHINRSRQVTSDDLDKEEARLEEDYNKRWISYEGFHLEAAFNSQRLRIERDWGVHEKSLVDDYNARKRLICPTQPSAESSAQSGSSGSDRWHNAEKQKTLFNTVPVMAPKPSKQETLAGSGARAVRGNRSKDDELELLDKQFSASLGSLQQQREAALRWMSRQKIRLMAQAEAAHEERVAIGELMSLENRAHQAMALQSLRRRSQSKAAP